MTVPWEDLVFIKNPITVHSEPGVFVVSEVGDIADAIATDDNIYRARQRRSRILFLLASVRVSLCVCTITEKTTPRKLINLVGIRVNVPLEWLDFGDICPRPFSLRAETDSSCSVCTPLGIGEWTSKRPRVRCIAPRGNGVREGAP